MVKDYARKRNHYDLAHQQVLLIQESGLNNNFKSNFKSDNNIKANIKSNTVNIKWLWVICVAMLVLFFLLIISMKMMSSVEKTHQTVKSVSKKVSQPDFEFYSLLSDAKKKQVANSNSDSKSNLILSSINKSEISGDLNNNKINNQANSASSIVSNKNSNNAFVNINKKDVGVSGEKDIRDIRDINDKKNQRVRKIDFSLLDAGPYHVIASGFKSYSSANKVRAELILNNIMAVVENKGSKVEYQVALPSADNKEILGAQASVLSSIGIVNYKII